jgi:hypothetical protein
MDRLKKYVLPAAGLVGLALVMDLTQVGHVMAQAAKQVVVANAPSQPIPTRVQSLPAITGNVAVTNSPAVTLQPGSFVGIDPSSNTVRIGGTVSVFSVDELFRVPAAPTIGMSYPGGQLLVTQNACIFVGGVCIGPTVPAGQRLVIESASVDIRVPPGQKVIASVHGGGQSLTIPVTLQGAFFGQDVFQGAQPVRFYADAGQSVGASIQRTSGSGDFTLFANFSGYLVNVQ